MMNSRLKQHGQLQIILTGHSLEWYLMTYQLPDSIQEIAMEGEFDEFDLNVFFSAKGEGCVRWICLQE